MSRLHGDQSKINACQIKEKPGMWDDYWSAWHNTEDFMEHKLQKVESILLTRLADENLRGLFNFMKATIPDTPIGEIEKALVS